MRSTWTGESVSHRVLRAGRHVICEDELDGGDEASVQDADVGE